MLKKAIASLSYWVDLTSKSQQELLKIEAEEERRFLSFFFFFFFFFLFQLFFFISLDFN